MKKVKLKKEKIKENNLGYNFDTKCLIFCYRKLKYMELGARKFAPNFDEAIREESGDNPEELKSAFISYVLDTKSPLPNEYFYSNKAGIFASLFRILKEKDLLEETIAEVACLTIHGIKDEKIIFDYTSHLNYYINHPEIHNEYKHTKRNYLKDIEEFAKPIYNKLFHILENKGHLKVTEKEEVGKLIKNLKNCDNKFVIRSVVLEDFFNSEAGKKLREEDKIEIALRVGALDSSSIYYYDEEGNLV